MGIVAVLVAAIVGLVPPDPITLSPPVVTIYNGTGDQYDPHVDGDVAAFTDWASHSIHYYRFSTATGSVISSQLDDGGVARDELSDVDRERIVFSRLHATTASLMLFDTRTAELTEVAPSTGSVRLSVGLGNDTLAFMDWGITPNFTGDLLVFDLSTRALTRLTDDEIIDLNPQVSNDGSTIVWERCVVASNCEVARATRAGSGWSISLVTSSPFSDSNPDTNGTHVVFERLNPAGPTGTDIVISLGGVETVLELPGEQFNPSIRGDLLAFEGRVGSTSDIFLYQLSSGRLFQVTSTPGVNETLNDVTLAAEGQARIVWQADGELGANNNIYGATFMLPPVDSDGGVGGGTGGAGGGGGGAGGGGGTTCTSQRVVLEASRTYRPSRWADGAFTGGVPIEFALPSEVRVTEGNAGNQWLRLFVDTGASVVECRYRGGGSRMHPVSPDDVASGLRYAFVSCKDTGIAWGPGTVVTASSLRLHIVSGDALLPSTRVSLSLDTICPVAETTSTLQGDDASGCSTTSSFSIGTLMLLWLLCYPHARRIRAITGRGADRLPR